MISEKNIKILRKKNIKATPIRTLVLDHLQQLATAVSLSELEMQLERTDRITLYRTLKTFENHGLIHSIDDGTGAPKYALCSDDCGPKAHHDTHLHFFCRQCETTYCLPSVQLPNLALPANFQADEANLVLKGICDGCNQ